MVLMFVLVLSLCLVVYLWMFWVMCMEQNFGLYIEQKCVVLVGFVGRVLLWNFCVVLGFSDSVNWLFQWNLKCVVFKVLLCFWVCGWFLVKLVVCVVILQVIILFLMFLWFGNLRCFLGVMQYSIVVLVWVMMVVLIVEVMWLQVGVMLVVSGFSVQNGVFLYSFFFSCIFLMILCIGIWFGFLIIICVLWVLVILVSLFRVCSLVNCVVLLVLVIDFGCSLLLSEKVMLQWVKILQSFLKLVYKNDF